MKLRHHLLLCGLLLGTTASAAPGDTFNGGPTPIVSTTQEYEIPTGAPADDYLWVNDYVGKQSYEISFGTYSCTDSATQQTCTHQGSGSTMTMILTERRSGMKHALKVQAYSEAMLYDTTNPQASTFCGGRKPLNNANRYKCGSDEYTNTDTLTAYITQSEMNNLPVGGVWEGQLKLQFRDPYWNIVQSYVANITLKGKATGKQDIYFPEFNGANPLVQLDLHPTGSVTSNSYVEDVTNLDMCLYDGFNSNSDSMTLSFKDEGKAAAARQNGYFSIYNTATGGTDKAERIDYRVEMFDPHSKGWRAVKNNDSFTLSAGVNGQDQIRPVRLPSITYPVLCAPAPLRLIVDKFRVTDKSAGYYKGVLTVEFSPSLDSI